MATEWAGLIGFVVALGLALLRVPVAVAMALVGIGGTLMLMDWSSASYVMASLPFEAIFPYGLSVVPLFIFMGVFASHSGLSGNLFRGITAFAGHRRGGLAASSVGASAIFGAICGSSLATCATMGRVALPEMQSRGYAKSLAGASIAAGGTLGVLIPPSILLVIYALMTEQSIGALFAGAMIPGVLATVLYIISIRLQVMRKPELAPVSDYTPWSQRWGALLRMWDAIVLILLVIGGIYAGLFSPTEAAAVGAGGALLFAFIRKKLTWTVLRSGIRETAGMTGMIFLILIGASLFNFFIETSGLTQTLVNWITSQGFSPLAVLISLLVFYVVLGCFMDSLSMILLTVVPAYSVITGVGYDPVWFGVVLVSVVEIGLITPPIGMNLFIIQGVAPDMNIATLSRGILPFLAADFIRVVLMIAIPGLIMWLPQMLGLGGY
ncbi:TRAP transporter large permease [Thalassospira mesophila]|uniref:TRAP transporter large permease protein n=1 Tax=Thalassospira mesophila TaxID=1293891 RepID=A0A1Y2KYY4_9PROT|nr:TRAP transporter large permease [Thalassospira mesophila]OSQ37381.1 C4-dicarboxylate ABC transporter permease [Thalassospira mesophila]